MTGHAKQYNKYWLAVYYDAKNTIFIVSGPIMNKQAINALHCP